MQKHTRQRINLSVTQEFYEELGRICRDYRFTNICEICTALLSVFVQKVRSAEARPKKVSNEQIIQQMFAELESYEPTPTSIDVFYKDANRNRTTEYSESEVEQMVEEQPQTIKYGESDIEQTINEQLRTISPMYMAHQKRRKPEP